MHVRNLFALALTVASALALGGCAAPGEEAEGGGDDSVGADESDFTAGAGPQFSCKQTPMKEAGSGEQAQVVAVRVAAQAGFDRMVVEFAPTKSKPAWELTPQKDANFTMDMSGDPVKLKGAAGLDLLVRDANSAEYKGPTKFQPKGAKAIVDVAQTMFFEGQSAWGIGLSKAGCYRVFRLANPPRLVLDVKH